MIVMILDLDWMFDKSEIPSVDCMRISSFHKQRKDSVYFVDNLTELTLQYDILYLYGNSDSTPAINSKILNDDRTVLMGKRFALCGAKKIGAVIAGCRPDYLLYDITNEKSNSYSKANFITFFTDCGEKVYSRQAWKNTKKGVKRTIVTDTILWKQKPSEVIKCFEELKDEKNIVFLEPISLNFLITNAEVQEKFIHLNFSRGTEFKWRNDFGSDAEHAQHICNFINKLKLNTKSRISPIPINPSEYAPLDWEEDFNRLIQTISIFKENKVRCFLPYIYNKPEHKVINWIRNWCDKGIENSFIEELLFFTIASKGKRWFQIINDKQYWSDNRVKFLLNILQQPYYQNLLPRMSIQWGKDSIDYKMIDLDKINKEASMII